MRTVHIHIHDAAMRAPLYARYPLAQASADALRAWTKSIGFEYPSYPMHVTTAYSTRPFDHSLIPLDRSGLVIPSGGRALTAFGKSLVLLVECSALVQRWNQYRRAGASWDYPGYRPHITLAQFDLDASPAWPKVKVFNDPITLLGEERDQLRN